MGMQEPLNVINPNYIRIILCLSLYPNFCVVCPPTYQMFLKFCKVISQWKKANLQLKQFFCNVKVTHGTCKWQKTPHKKRALGHYLYSLKCKWMCYVLQICIHDSLVPNSFKHLIVHWWVFFLIPNSMRGGCKIILDNIL
jgi:hypothetical protein